MSVLALALVTPKVRAGLYMAAFRIVHDTGAASEILEDAVSRALEKVERDRPVNFVAWVYAIVRNAAYHWRRDRMKQEGLLEESKIPRCYRSAAEEVMSREALESFVFACRGLTERQRQALYLRIYDQLSFEEVGRKMGIPNGAARALFWRAKAHLEAWRRAILPPVGTE